jgi:alkylation response protein AidB-like acyl-CoA dehydrogenase
VETLLTEQQKASYEEFKQFVASNVQPYVAEWDRAQRHPESIIFLLGNVGYLGSCIPLKYAGRGWGFVTFGLLSEALGRGSPALSNLLTVQAMVAMTLLKWGTEEQKNRWIPQLAKGEIIGAFALSEAGAGSSTQSLQSELRRKNSSLVLNGQKKWISYGEIARVFLVFGKLDEEFVACLVPREAVGLEVEPIRDMLGLRAAGLATITFHDVEVPSVNIVGKPGFALSHIAPVGLHYGRMATGCSAAGLLRACFEESISYGATRKVAGQSLGDIGMIQSLIARLGSDLQAAQLLFYAACRAEDEQLPQRFAATLVAKYHNSKAAVVGSSDAVQIRGASGCHESSSVARHYRDAKLMEILEGTTQVHEHILGKIFANQATQVDT